MHGEKNKVYFPAVISDKASGEGGLRDNLKIVFDRGIFCQKINDRSQLFSGISCWVDLHLYKIPLVFIHEDKKCFMKIFLTFSAILDRLKTSNFLTLSKTFVSYFK